MNLCKDCISKGICGNPNVTGCISYTKQDENFLPINCYVCNASGRIMGNGHRHSSKCTRCNGTGKINYYTMTNEDFLRTATTEQLAEFISKIDMPFMDKAPFPCGDLIECNKNCGLYSRCVKDDFPTNKEVWVEWLKQPHITE